MPAAAWLALLRCPLPFRPFSGTPPDRHMCLIPCATDHFARARIAAAQSRIAAPTLSDSRPPLAGLFRLPARTATAGVASVPRAVSPQTSCVMGLDKKKKRHGKISHRTKKNANATTEKRTNGTKQSEKNKHTADGIQKRADGTKNTNRNKRHFSTQPRTSAPPPRWGKIKKILVRRD